MPALAQTDDIDRPGKGNWCYNPVRAPTKAEKTTFVEEISVAAIAAEKKWGVPAPVIAGMSIVESGYGLTRIAIKSNNILAFKWPGDKVAAGLKKFDLWCQPSSDVGQIYPAFASRADAIDFVASRLNRSDHYKGDTATYKRAISKGVGRRSAAAEWLRGIADPYNYKPLEYIVAVTKMVDDPLGDGSRSLWSLEPKP